MGQDFITSFGICSFAPYSQAAVEFIPNWCVFERNRPTPVQRQLNLTHAGFPANNAMQGPCGSCKGCLYGTRTGLAAGAVVARHGLTSRV